MRCQRLDRVRSCGDFCVKLQQADLLLEFFAPLAEDAQVKLSRNGNARIEGDRSMLRRALSNLLDYFLEEYFFRPSAIVCYSAGQFGGVRAAMQLRAMLCEVGMPSISSLCPIPSIATALNEAGECQDARLAKRFARFASEFEWYAGALAVARRAGTPY